MVCQDTRQATYIWWQSHTGITPHGYAHEHTQPGELASAVSAAIGSCSARGRNCEVFPGLACPGRPGSGCLASPHVCCPRHARGPSTFTLRIALHVCWVCWRRDRNLQAAHRTSVPGLACGSPLVVVFCFPPDRAAWTVPFSHLAAYSLAALLSSHETVRYRPAVSAPTSQESACSVQLPLPVWSPRLVVAGMVRTRPSLVALISPLWAIQPRILGYEHRRQRPSQSTRVFISDSEPQGLVGEERRTATLGA